MPQKTWMQTDDIIGFQQYLSQKPEVAYTSVDSQSLLEFLTQHNAFQCARVLYSHMRADMLNNKSPLPVDQQKRIFTNTLINLVPYFYEDPAAYRLFDYMILECAQLVNLPPILKAVEKKYEAAFCKCLTARIQRHLPTTKAAPKILPLPDDYSL